MTTDNACLLLPQLWDRLGQSLTRGAQLTPELQSDYDAALACWNSCVDQETKEGLADSLAGDLRRINE